MREIDFTIHRVVIPVEAYGKRPFYLIPFGDIHRFAPNCDEEKWLEFLDWAKKKKDCWFVGMGDMDDALSYSERRGLNCAALHESTEESLEDMFLRRTERLISEISFMKGKLIGLLEGNHWAPLSGGITSTQYMCQKLGCKYLGYSAFIRLSCEYIKGNRTTCVDIWAHHGRGGGRTIGSTINTVDQMSNNAEVDIVMMGHLHKKSVATKCRLSLGNGKGGLKYSQKKILLINTGSFLKGYEPERSSYVARHALSPSDLGVVKIELTPRVKQEHVNGKLIQDDFYIDLHASI